MTPRFAVCMSVLALFAAACGDSSGRSPEADLSSTTTPRVATTATAAPTTAVDSDPQPTDSEPDVADGEFTIVTSADGDLLVQVPPSVTAAVTIDILDPSEWPAPLTDAATTGDVKIYDLGPHGITFEEPVRVARRLDLDGFSDLDLGITDVPLVTLLTTDADGRYELLDNLTLLRVGNEVWVSGTTDHFSPLISSNERVPVHIGVPGPPVVTVDESELGEKITSGGSEFVLLFSEPMDVHAVEDTFVVPSFTDDDLAHVPMVVLPFEDDLDLVGDTSLSAEFLTEARPVDIGGPVTYPGGRPLIDDLLLGGELPFSIDGRALTPPAFDIFGIEGTFAIADLASTNFLLHFLEGPDPSDGPPPDRLDVTFGVFTLRTGFAEPPPDVRLGLPGGLNVVLEVVHRPGERGHPSFIRARLDDGPPTPHDTMFFSTSALPSFDDFEAVADARIIDMARFEQDGDAAIADAGIECFCPYGFGLVTSPAGTSLPPVATIGDLVGLPNVNVQLFSGLDGIPLGVNVTQQQGPVFTGEVELIIVVSPN